MKERNTSNIKLGVFVIAGIALLLFSLFMIGRNRHLMGSHFELKTHFTNVAGLKKGNNVRYSGIEVGTVKDIVIINDTTLEVVMFLDKDMSKIIRKNAMASLGSDGLMGRKVVNIEPVETPSAFAVGGDILASRGSVSFDDVLRTLARSGENISVISEDLKLTVARINSSKGFWKLMSDSGLAQSLKKTSGNLERATRNADMVTRDVQEIIADVKAGRGPVGTVLRDTAMAEALRSSVFQLQTVSANANKLAVDLDKMAQNLNEDIQEGNGTVNLVLSDTALAGNIRRTLVNVEKGTAAFNENMEAAKHNFLFRGYFKKQEKEKAKQQKTN
jgi:phospholipid/cholesterol/gamma-HCH transport system substrate-binding protein